jgi:hypothetical protein
VAFSAIHQIPVSIPIFIATHNHYGCHCSGKMTP